jgi:hypothetical protein
VHTMTARELILAGIAVSSWSPAQRDVLVRLLLSPGAAASDFVPAVWNRVAKAEAGLKLKKAGHVVCTDGRWLVPDCLESPLAVMGQEVLKAARGSKQLALPADPVAIAVVTSGPVQDRTGPAGGGGGCSLAGEGGNVILSQSRSGPAPAAGVSVAAEAVTVKAAFVQLREHLDGRAPPPVLSSSHHMFVPPGTDGPVQDRTAVPSETGRVEGVSVSSRTGQAPEGRESLGSSLSRPGQDVTRVRDRLIDIESEAKSIRLCVWIEID